MVSHLILADILLIARIFPRPCGARKNTTQLAKYPRVLYVKPSNKMYFCHDRVTSLRGCGSQRSLRRPRKFGTRMIRKKFHKIFENIVFRSLLWVFETIKCSKAVCEDASGLEVLCLFHLLLIGIMSFLLSDA